jgi:ATP-dependent exoDNAse (exonuclease V) beta subunit
MIVFDEASHTYTNSETQEKYISVTTLLGLFKPYFDKDKHSARIAERQGVPQSFILDEWEEITRIACAKGTKIHKIMEEYIKNNVVIPKAESLYESYKHIYMTHVGSCNTIHCEKLLFNIDNKIAGTADLIFESANSFIVGDFKTNKDFRYSSKFNNKLETPVQHLDECEFNIYALQLSLYAYMYEILTQKVCKQLIIFYLVNSKWIPIPCNYLKNDIKEILKHYRLNSFE